MLQDARYMMLHDLLSNIAGLAELSWDVVSATQAVFAFVFLFCFCFYFSLWQPRWAGFLNIVAVLKAVKAVSYR